MTDSTLKLLELIKQGKSINEISEEMNISHKRLYNRLTLLRNKGFNFDRKYYYTGDIVYVPRNYISQNQNNSNSGINILTSPNDKEFKSLAISDLHIGSNRERLDLLNKVYDYCINEGINIIIIAGDIINGMFGSQTKHDNVIDQIDYALKNYPFDKNILNFAVLGNHDINSLHMIGQDFADVLSSYRHDIVPLGYGTGKINVKNEKIIVRHPLVVESEEPINCAKNIVLKGHSHRMKITNYKNGVLVGIPSLSDIVLSENEILPGAVKMTIKFKNGYFWNVIVEHLLVGEKIYSINEMYFELGRNKPVAHSEQIKLEEERVKKRQLVPV